MSDFQSFHQVDEKIPRIRNQLQERCYAQSFTIGKMQGEKVREQEGRREDREEGAGERKDTEPKCMVEFNFTPSSTLYL